MLKTLYKIIAVSLIILLAFVVFTDKEQPTNIEDNPLAQAITEHKGKVIYLDFWASWCGPCRQSFPWLNDMQDKYKNLKIISINLDNDKRLADEFLTATPANFTVIYDPKGKLAKQYKIKGMPSSYLINKAGELVGAHSGFSVSKQDKYEQEIILLLAE
ncbi:MAG: TlpA family protein disulfide reductase [Colwellia sp.]|nr:TlpA family protein disulfide reductase [Colwellia sp.]